MNFDQKPTGHSDHFIRHSPEMLNGIFGTTEVKPFWVADMDFAVAEPIRAELQRLVDRGQFAYEFNSKGVFNAISDWYQRRHQLNLTPDNFVQVPGVLTGLSLLVRELTELGDSVLIQTPAYHQFAKVVRSAGRNLVQSPLQRVDGQYRMDFDDLDNKLSKSDVKLMVLCNPHNPVGRVWQPQELEQLLQLANRHQVTLISDEIHADIIYRGHKFTSLMALDADNHIALLGSPAKTFGMQSISNGYIYTANSELFTRMSDLADAMYLNHGNALTTFATIAAYQQAEPWLDALLSYLETSRDWITDFITAQMPYITAYPVEGTYQIWLNFSATGLSGEALIKALADAGFGASPGTWFDSEAGAFARMNFAAPKAEIESAFARLKTVLDQRISQATTTTTSVGAAEQTTTNTRSCC